MRKRRALWLLAVGLVLAATALAYRHPAVMIQLGEQVWACFG